MVQFWTAQSKTFSCLPCYVTDSGLTVFCASCSVTITPAGHLIFHFWTGFGNMGSPVGHLEEWRRTVLKPFGSNSREAGMIITVPIYNFGSVKKCLTSNIIFYPKCGYISFIEGFLCENCSMSKTVRKRVSTSSVFISNIITVCLKVNVLFLPKHLAREI